MSDNHIKVEVEDESSDRSFFAMIPGILRKMHLGSYAVNYYFILKSIAGEGGKCYMTQKNLAREVGCSIRQIQKINENLSQPFEILNEKPLIKIIPQKRR